MKLDAKLAADPSIRTSLVSMLDVDNKVASVVALELLASRVTPPARDVLILQTFSERRRSDGDAGGLGQYRSAGMRDSHARGRANSTTAETVPTLESHRKWRWSPPQPPRWVANDSCV